MTRSTFQPAEILTLFTETEKKTYSAFLFNTNVLFSLRRGCGGECTQHHHDLYSMLLTLSL